MPSGRDVCFEVTRRLNEDIEERVKSLAGTLASPVGDQDSEEKARRKALREFVVLLFEKPGYVAKLFSES